MQVSKVFIVAALCVGPAVFAESPEHPDLDRARTEWNRARASTPSSGLDVPAAVYRRAALDALARLPSAAPAARYEWLLRADGLVLTELGRRRVAASRRCKECARLASDLAQHVTLDPVQKIVDYRDPRGRVEIRPYPALDYVEQVTYSVWIKLLADVGVYDAKVVSHAGVNGGKLALMLDPGNRVGINATFEGHGSTRVKWDHALPTRRWVHVALVFDGGRGFRLWIDGEPVPRPPEGVHTSGSRIASRPQQVLFLGGLDRSLPGLLDDVRIYDRALTDEQVGVLAAGGAVESGLVGHWPLDETSGPVARNRFGEGNDGRVGEDVALGAPGAPAPGDGSSYRFGKSVEDWTKRLHELQVGLHAAEIRAAAAMRTTEAAVRAKDLLDHLRSRRAVLVHYVEDEPRDRLLAFRLDASAATPVIETELGSLSGIRRAAAVLADMLSLDNPSGRAEEATYRAAARRLAQSIWDPIGVPPEVDREILLRLGPALHGVPFAALVDASGRYLVDSHVFGRAGPVSHLPARGDTRRPDPLVAFGNPAYAGFPGIPAPEVWTSAAPKGGRRDASAGTCVLPAPRILFGARRELELLRELYASRSLTADVSQWQEAYETDLRRRAESSGSIHIATHPYRLDRRCLPETPENPLLEVGLQMAGIARLRPEDSRKLDDGFLSAFELSRLSLDRVSVVVFSGCSTARGPSCAGADVLGLPAAAWIAGAGGSLATLWDVEDETMPEHVLAFHAGRTGGLTLARSLRRALLVARDATRRDRGHTHPAYWAAMVVEGQ